MANNIKQSYGSWDSPITSSRIVQSGIEFGNLQIDRGILYWNELRPEEAGRSIVLKWDGKNAIEINPKPYNVRSRVHEYGGGAFTIDNGTLYFSNDSDQHFCAISSNGIVRKLTTFENKRYANPIYNSNTHVIYAIEETVYSNNNVINALVAIDINGKNQVKTICKGHDFYSSIAINPNKNQLTFLAWNHPSMPWDETELFIGEILYDGSLTNVKKIAGGNGESIFQPKYAQDSSLFFISDRTGFWNLYKLNPKGLVSCYPLDAEFGSPQWVFGMSRYDFILINDEINLVCCYTRMGQDHIAILDPKKHILRELPLYFTSYREIHIVRSELFFLAGSLTEGEALYCYDLNAKALSLIRKSQGFEVDPGFISIPKKINFPTENKNIAYGFYYPPKNKNFVGPSNELPPLIVNCHGGPSDHVSPTFNFAIQFWTSRGFAFFDVNYGGSTGYGRKYRERLKGKWGIVDVADCCNGALYLVKEKLVDPKRLAIRGGSAGGFTTLAALAFENVFKAGTSYFGVSDLIMLAKDTHKFESHYLNGLIGKYPEEKARYQQFSPIYHVEKISQPVLFLQGDEDRIVPPNQTKMIFESLKKRGIPTSFFLMKGEQHGFRKAESIKASLDAELYFYSQIFHFTPYDIINPIPIENYELKN